MPGIQGLVLNVARHLAEAVLAPLAAFYVVNVFFGLWPALGAAAVWIVLAIIVYLVRGGRPSALLFASAGLAALQIVVTAVTQQARVFFLQPAIATYLFGIVMIVTSWSRRPLIQRLAFDFVPLPDEVLEATAIRRFFRWLSWLWGGCLLINASLTLACLFLIRTNLAVPVATAASAPVFLVALVVSYRLFRRSVRVAGFVLDWGGAESSR